MNKQIDELQTNNNKISVETVKKINSHIAKLKEIAEVIKDDAIKSQGSTNENK